ncbi:MAG: hypothetical protein IPJ41_03710 [Phycisphaerales bacterium]|nr:hypothetical protein [Phycisphaerales bacterium]
MPERHAPRPTPSALPTLLAIGVFVLAAWPLILSGFVKGRGAFDQLNYHEQVVRTFADQWPRPDYSDYLSATTPGYHTALAAIAHMVSDDRRVLQLAGSAFTIALIVLLGRGLRPRRADGPPRAVAAALLLVLVCSMPVFYSGVWLLPDNAGWLGVLAVWLLALRHRFDAWTILGGGAALAVLLFVRQIHLWPLAMLLTSAWLGTRTEDDGPFDMGQDLHAILARPGASLGRSALMIAASLPALAVLAWFWTLWHGLTPPVFRDRHVGGNFSAPVFVLAVFGMYSLFFIPYLVEGLRQLWTRHTWLLALALLVGLTAAFAAPSNYSTDAGRYSGLWNLARRLPTPGERSVLVVPLAVVGAGLLAAWFVSMSRRDRWIMLAAFVGFTAAQCASFKLWQRYTEPFVLLWLVLGAARVASPRTAAGVGWRVLAPAVLALGLAAMTGASLWMAAPVAPRALVAPWEREVPILPGMLGSEPRPGHRDDEPRPNGRSD